jgi:release factor glutamine methyltransferase
MMKNITQLLAWAMNQLTASDSARLDAEVLLCHLLKKDRSYLFTWNDKVVDDATITHFATLVARRQKGEPVAHILGYREFWSLELEVSSDTLIPRPDTEVLVEQALICIPNEPCQVLDLGTGTGAVALAIASECPQATVTAVEFQHKAAELARRNAHRCHLSVNILQGSWFEPLAPDQRFAVIVSNPPYIEADDPHLEQGDVRFEPLTALVAAQDGLADLTHIIQQGYYFLQHDGWLLVEHGFEQGAAVRALFTNARYHQVTTYKDYGSNDRITVGQKKEA